MTKPLNLPVVVSCPPTTKQYLSCTLIVKGDPVMAMFFNLTKLLLDQSIILCEKNQQPYEFKNWLSSF